MTSKLSGWIALRYLKTNRDNRFFSWITILSMLGVSLGVAALIVVLSVISGFEHELRDLFLRANAHVMAFKYPNGLKDFGNWEQRIAKDFAGEVTALSPFVHYESMVKFTGAAAGGTRVESALIRGMIPAKREQIQSLRDVVSPYQALRAIEADQKRKAKGPKGYAPPIIIGSGLMAKLGAKLGDEVKMISAAKDFSSTQLLPYRIAGVYNSGLKHYDNKIVFMSLRSAQGFFHMDPKVVTGLEIALVDPGASLKVAERMKKAYPRITFREWHSFNRPIFEAMKTEKRMISLLVAIVMVVATFNILTTIFIAVSEKQKEISILKALGASEGQIIAIFTSQGAIIGVVGGLLGCVLALAICAFLENVPILDLPDPYFLKTLPVMYSPSVYISICAFSVFMCIIAGLYPAWVGSKVKPAVGFKGA